MAEMSIAEALRQAIREEMQRDPRVFCIFQAGLAERLRLLWG